MSSLQKKPVALSLAVVPGIALVCAILAPCPSGASAEHQTLVLKNGARLDGEILKEGRESVFFDLGYNVLAVPRTSIETVTTPTLAMPEATSPTVARGEQARNLPAVERRAFESRTQMLEACKRGVVIVSNPAGFGAGFLIDRRGRVLTNYHVVRNQQYHAVTLILRGEDGVMRRKKIENVELVAFSRLFDIALLQAPSDAIKDVRIDPLPLGEYAALEVGDPVYAIGNPGMGRQLLDHTVSNGIVSSTNRNLGDVLYLQTTAPVNPGNSGGPLLNADGEVVGLVTLKATFQESIAFALPVNYIRLFLLNEKAYAFDKSNPNRSYRYLSPDLTEHKPAGKGAKKESKSVGDDTKEKQD